MSMTAVDPYVLAQLLLRKGLVSQAHLLRALQYYLLRRLGAGELAYRISSDRAQASLIDDDGRDCNVLDWPELTAPPRGWVPYSPDVLALFDGKTGEFLRVVARSDVQGPGLGEAGGMCRHAGNLYAIGSWLDERLPAIDGPHWPLDVYLPNGPGESIAIADRAAGVLYLVEPTLTKVVAELTMRPAGSRKAINIAYSSSTRTLYATDGTSPDLIVIRLQSHSLERLYQDVGVAGNLQVSPDGSRLFVLVGDGETAIEALRTSDFQSQGRVLVPGKRFGDLDDPCDLMALSPDGQYLVVMTYQDVPSLFTPMISVVSVATMQVLSTTPLDKSDKPVGLAFSLPGHLPAAPSFARVLLDRELISQADLTEALRELGLLTAEAAKPDLDADVAMLAVSPAASGEAADLARPDAAATQRLTESTTFKWASRPNMTAAEKESLLKGANELKPGSEISDANGYFVLNWIRDLLTD